MPSNDDGAEKSPFNGWFIASGVLVGLVAVAGIIIGVRSGAEEPVAADASPTLSQPTPTASTSVSAASSSPADVDAVSVCGLAGEKTSGTLVAAPPAQWVYQDAMAYPTSTTYGPGATSPDGVRYCFQRSPEGALFAAANAAVQASDPAALEAWLTYFIAQPGRDAVLDAKRGSSNQTAGVRVEIAGYKLLSYDGDSARIDLAVRGSQNGTAVNLSMIYTLIWQSGDWKLSVANPAVPLNVAVLPNLASYISWSVNDG